MEDRKRGRGGDEEGGECPGRVYEDVGEWEVEEVG